MLFRSVHCTLTQWGDYGACDKTCGASFATRTRQVKYAHAHGGQCNGALKDDKVCERNPCPRDCVVDDWQAWGACSVTCGEGTQTRKRATIEATAQSEYDKVSQENKITKTTMSQDAKYKSQEATSLDKEVSELSSDKQTTSTELSAVLEYYGKLKDRCVAKPESYADRKARRAAEIAGLKEALDVLENETAFVQRKRRGLRGTLAA